MVVLSLATMVMYAETMLVLANQISYELSYSIASWILIIYLITGAVMTPYLW